MPSSESTAFVFQHTGVFAMKIGVLKERKQEEYRVALRPDQARLLVDAGHQVCVEHDAGKPVGFQDGDYQQAGATVTTQREVYERSRLLLKVKCPLPDEYGLLRADHVLFTYLHFDENIAPENITQIVNTGVTGIAYEWVEQDGDFPLLAPMSRLTGAVFARKAMSLLMEAKHTLGGQYQPAWPQSTAMVIGAGHIGCNAIAVLVRNRFRVLVVDKHPETFHARLERFVGDEAKRVENTEVIRFDETRPQESAAALRSRLPEVDIVICAAVRRPSLPKEKCEFLIRRADVATMAANTVICDATACDYDFIETAVSSSSLTDHYVEEGVLHYSCDHIPSLVASTATSLLTDATFPYVRMLCDGFEQAARRSEPLAKGVMCHRGKLTHERSARKKSLAYTDLKTLL